MNADSSPSARHGLVGRQVGRLDRRVGPAPEVLPVRLVDPEQLGDHHERERRGQLGHEVDLARALDRVEQARGALVRIDSARPASARGVKRRFTSPRKAACSGGSMCRIERADIGAPAARMGSLTSAPAARAEVLRVAAEVPDVLVAGDRPEPRPALVHRVLGAQPRQHLVVVRRGRRRRRPADRCAGPPAMRPSVLCSTDVTGRASHQPTAPSTVRCPHGHVHERDPNTPRPRR